MTVSFREKGIPIGKNPDTSSIISFNPFDGSEFYNPHILIIGFTGSGKNIFIQYLTERLEAYTDYTIKLDMSTLATPNSRYLQYRWKFNSKPVLYSFSDKFACR